MPSLHCHKRTVSQITIKQFLLNEDQKLARQLLWSTREKSSASAICKRYWLRWCSSRSFFDCSENLYGEIKIPFSTFISKFRCRSST